MQKQTLADIPNEIKELILSYLEIKNIVNCSLISCDWNHVCSSPNFWKQIGSKIIKDFNIPSENVDFKTFVISKSRSVRFQSTRTKKSLNFIEMPKGLLLETPRTVEMWIRTTQDGVLLGHQDMEFPRGERFVPVIYVDFNGRLRGGYWTERVDGRGGYHVESKRKVNDGKWHHICLTHDDTYFELFLDGKSVGSRKGKKSKF
jgi:hypothetical protein